MFTSRNMQCIRSGFSKHGRYMRVVAVLFAICWIALLPSATFAQSPCPNPYIVVRGDIFGRIAQKCGVTQAAKQLQGCYLDNSNGNRGNWCGWRDGTGKPAQCLPVVTCP